MSVIEIDHLAKRFGDVRAVDDLSFAIEAEDLELGLQLQHVAGIVISVVVFTLLGLAAWVITRGQPVAVGAVVGLFVAERLLSVVIGDAAYLPYALLWVLNGIGGPTMSWSVAALWLTAITVAAVGLAAILLKRRDVT
jgi:hypothetical protein